MSESQMAGRYHIVVDKSIKSGLELLNLTRQIESGYHSWKEGRYIKRLLELEQSPEEIASITESTRQNIHTIIKNHSDHLVIVGGENKQASADERATACLSSLPIRQTPKSDSTDAGQADEGVGQEIGEAIEVVDRSHKATAVGSTPTPRTKSTKDFNKS